MIIFRYLNREILVTTLAVSSVLLLIFMSGRFVKYLADAAAGELAVDVLFTIMGYRLPGFLELIIPLGFFIAILLAYGRLYTDSEMVVLSACGISQAQLVVITLIPAFMLSVLVGFLSLWVSPTGARATETILAEQRTRSEFDTIQPGRFQALGDSNSMAYITEVSDDRTRLQTLFVAQGGREAGAERHSVLVAEYAEQAMHPEYEQRYLYLHNGRRYEGQPGAADYEVTEFETFAQYMKPPNIEASMRGESDTWSTADLIGAEDLERRTTLQWRLSLPVLVLVVALMAVPFSRTDPRRGRYAKMLPAIVLYMLYLGTLSGLRGALESGSFPLMPGFWLVHGVFLAIALLMLSWQNLKLGRQKRRSRRAAHA